MHDLWKYSPLLYCLERLFAWLEYLSPANLLFGTRVQAQRRTHDEKAMKESMLARGRRVEAYVVLCALGELLLAVVTPFAQSWLLALCVALPLFRVFEITQTAINLNFFERLRIHPSDSHFVASHVRTVVLTLWNFFEIMFCFGIVYSARLDLLHGAENHWDAYYFSVMTQLTIGYGDVHPLRWARLAAAIQAMVGFFFALVVLTRLATFLPRSASILRHSSEDDPGRPPRPDEPQ